MVGLQNLAICVQRRKLRKKWNIKGSSLNDCCASCFCNVNVLYQNEQESYIRVLGKDLKTGQRWEGKAGDEVIRHEYQSPAAMRM